jgi:hypothetical protein
MATDTVAQAPTRQQLAGSECRELGDVGGEIAHEAFQEGSDWHLVVLSSYPNQRELHLQTFSPLSAR